MCVHIHGIFFYFGFVQQLPFFQRLSFWHISHSHQPHTTNIDPNYTFLSEHFHTFLDVHFVVHTQHKQVHLPTYEYVCISIKKHSMYVCMYVCAHMYVCDGVYSALALSLGKSFIFGENQI